MLNQVAIMVITVVERGNIKTIPGWTYAPNWTLWNHL